MNLYNQFQEIAPDHTVKLDRVGADIPIVRRHGSSFRRLTLIGSDGSQRHFIVQTSLTPNARSDERILQLFRVMNQMFDKHKESRRRHICIHTPIIIPVWSQVIKSAFNNSFPWDFKSWMVSSIKWTHHVYFIFFICWLVRFNTHHSLSKLFSLVQCVTDDVCISMHSTAQPI